jgi:hypothetical protein
MNHLAGCDKDSWPFGGNRLIRPQLDVPCLGAIRDAMRRDDAGQQHNKNLVTGDHRKCGRARRNWNTPPDGRWQRLQLSHRQRGCEKKSGAEQEHVL